MIRKVYSRTLKTFKTIEFKKGFNFIVSESIDGKSNNGTGKTSLIQIINFCFGSSNENISTYEILNQEEFSIDIEINNKIVTLSRTPQNYSKIKVIDKDGLFECGIIDDEEKTVDWVKSNLNRVIFGIQNEEITFRTLISPFMKRGTFAFNNMYKTHSVETNIVTQLKNSFLMNIPIQPILELKRIIEERETFLKLKEIKETDIIWKKEKVSTLKSKLRNIDTQIKEKEQILKNFELTLSEKDDISNIQKVNKELSSLLKRKYICINENELNKKILNNAVLLNTSQIREILDDAKLFVDENNLKKLEEIQQYHKMLNKNRQNRVSKLIEKNECEINAIDEQIDKENAYKNDILKKFDKKGYLDEYYNTNEMLVGLKIERNDLEKQLNVYLDLSKIDEDCKEKIKDVMTSLENNNNCENFKRVNEIFKGLIKEVFNVDSKLIMDCQNTGVYASRGYHYDWEIPRKLSSGYLKGCIAIYDLTLATFNSERFPISLIHDSIIFESTDKKYVAKFLNLVNDIVGNDKFQYICCVNDDQIVKSFLTEDLLEKYNSSYKFSQSNTLFGLEFGKR